MRIVVTGSRDWTDADFIHDVLDALDEDHGITALAEGGCRGADAHAFRWICEQDKDINWQEFIAQWETHGHAAGPERNARMLNCFRPDVVVAFKTTKKSKGTDDCIQKAKDRGIKVIVYVGPEKVEDTFASQEIQ